MRCPLRMKAFDQPDTCDEECAWLVRLVDLEEPTKTYLACAVSVGASDIGVVKSPANFIEDSEWMERLEDAIKEKER